MTVGMLLERENDGILVVVFEFFKIERRRGVDEWEYEEEVMDEIVKVSLYRSGGLDSGCVESSAV